MRTLYIDAATTTLYVGAFDAASWIRLLTTPASAGAMESLFDLAKHLFAEIPLASIDRVALNIGPGRLLSLRIAATAANQWAAGKVKATVTSLGLLSAHLDLPCVYPLRADCVGIWNGREVALTASAPAGLPMLASAVDFTVPTHPAYADAVDTLPGRTKLLATPTTFFDPPTFAPISYKLAENTVHSAKKH
jgi:hypothetical protein